MIKNGLIEYANGDKAWYKNDELHREDGPAVECSDGSKVWYKNDKLHREDGPAIEWADGDKYWYKNGKLIMKTNGLVTEAQLKMFKLKCIQ